MDAPCLFISRAVMHADRPVTAPERARTYRHGGDGGSKGKTYLNPERKASFVKPEDTPKGRLYEFHEYLKALHISVPKKDADHSC